MGAALSSVRLVVVVVVVVVATAAGNRASSNIADMPLARQRPGAILLIA